MNADELASLLTGLRRRGEPADLEVKSAAGGLPKSAVETVCAFANTNGGTLLLGVDGLSGFTVVSLADPARLRDDLVSAAGDQLEPPIRLETELVELEGQPSSSPTSSLSRRTSAPAM